MTQFKITYRDPQTQKLKTHVGEYEDLENITALEWAEDHAYSLTDKGWYKIEEVLQ